MQYDDAGLCAVKCGEMHQHVFVSLFHFNVEIIDRFVLFHFNFQIGTRFVSVEQIVFWIVWSRLSVLECVCEHVWVAAVMDQHEWE